MTVKHLKTTGTWRDVADCANTTIGADDGTKEPSSRWKKRMLLAEHSPIRNLIFHFRWSNLKYWVSTHFVRHKIGVEHFVKTQRTDRTGVDRDDLPQGSFVDHRITSNAQAMINISRKRLCKNASPETQQAWRAALEAIREKEPELFSACVPDCIYRGWCYDFVSCGYSKTKAYKADLEKYRSLP